MTTATSTQTQRASEWNAKYNYNSGRSGLFWMLSYHREAYFRRMEYALGDTTDSLGRRFWYRMALESKRDYKRLLHTVRDIRRLNDRLGPPNHTIGI